MMFLENENKYFDEQNKENYPHQHLTFQKERFLLPPTNINLLLTSASPVNIFHPMPISQSNSSFVFATSFPHKRTQKRCISHWRYTFYYWKIDDFTFLSRPLSQVFLV